MGMEREAEAIPITKAIDRGEWRRERIKKRIARWNCSVRVDPQDLSV